MTQLRSMISSGTGAKRVLPSSLKGMCLLLSITPQVELYTIAGWVSNHPSLDLGEMDLSQWPPRLKLSMVSSVGSKKASP
jgi:hypothetical protein